MKPHVSRARWILLATGIALAAGAFATRRTFRPEQFGGAAEIAALRTERESLQDSDDRSRDDWRRQADAARARPWNEGDLAALEARLGSGWRKSAAEAPADERFRRIEFTRDEAPLSDWPEFVRLVAELEQQPALSMVALDVAAGGAGARRRFTRMAFTVRVAWAASNGNAERSASLGPLPVSPPSPSAPRGRAGALPSLRRPAASADSGAGPAPLGNVPSSAPGAERLPHQP
jgi:hypothetical protein